MRELSKYYILLTINFKENKRPTYLVKDKKKGVSAKKAEHPHTSFVGLCMSYMIHAFKKIASTNLHYFNINEAKEFLKITGDDEDKLLRSLIAQVASMFEAYTGKILLTKEIVIEIKNFTTSALTFPVQPVKKVNSVKLIDQFGTENVLDPSEYNLYEPASILFFRNCPLSALVIIDFDAGMSDTSCDLPEDIKIALLKHIAFLYSNRDRGIDYDLNHYRKFKILMI